jgi:hypothetical protein
MDSFPEGDISLEDNADSDEVQRSRLIDWLQALSMGRATVTATATATAEVKGIPAAAGGSASSFSSSTSTNRPPTSTTTSNTPSSTASSNTSIAQSALQKEYESLLKIPFLDKLGTRIGKAGSKFIVLPHEVRSIA